MKFVKNIVISSCFSLSLIVSAQEENLNVSDRWIEWSDTKNMLIHHLNKQAFAFLEKRNEEIMAISTIEGWAKRQEKIKKALMDIVGPFPEKTPLNAKITGITKREGFRIEKILYESMPGFYVTAVLFMPEERIRNRPAIIHVSGHYYPSFRTEESQKHILNLVKKGFVVFAIDAISQGERIQYLDETGKSSQFRSTPSQEHSYFGNQMFLTGTSPIKYFVWDVIRGIDYLITRREVDPESIGIFGCSGGGTQTTFVAAFDDRIKAAVPGCYITGFRRLLESVGARDAEQNLYHGLLHGIDHADLLQIRVPEWLLISSTTLDYFSIQGAIETFHEVKRAYTAYNMGHKVCQLIDDAGHGFHNNISGIYDFFQGVFELPGDSTPEKIEIFEQDDLRVTPTGQIATSIKGTFAFDLNTAVSEKIIQNLNISRENISEHLESVTEKARVLSGYLAPTEVKPVFRGRYHRDGYSLEMYALNGEGDYIIPLLLFIPDEGIDFPSVIYLHPDGKAADAAPGGKIEELVRRGYIVAAPDVIGVGETKDESNLSYYASQYLSILIGRSIIGIQAGDISRVAAFLKCRKDINHDRIGALAFDESCVPLLHAAAFDKSISSVTLIGALISYRSVVMNKFYNQSFIKYFVAGALTSYDLPDLIGVFAPKKITLAGLKDQMKEPAPLNLIQKELSFPLKVYSQKNVPENVRIIFADDKSDSIMDWSLMVP